MITYLGGHNLPYALKHRSQVRNRTISAVTEFVVISSVALAFFRRGGREADFRNKRQVSNVFNNWK